jgi:DMSO/TMAO reductase YedYZ heme-binding membrane subunit
MDTIEISGSIGIIAAILFTLNILMGILLSSSYKKIIFWKQIPVSFKRYTLFEIHNTISYLLLVFVLIHVLLLPLDPKSGFNFSSLLWPGNVKHQSFFVLLGWLSALALMLVLITSQKRIKKALGFRWWKIIHLISYATGILFIVHGIVMDPLLKDRPVDYIDAEKLFVEFLGILLLIAFYWKYQYNKSKKSNVK